MLGRRLPDGARASDFRPGGYAWQSYDRWVIPPPAHPDFAGDGEWWLKSPDGCLNSARRHTVTVHDDGSITCEPSLVFSNGWHGLLERGSWRSA